MQTRRPVADLVAGDYVHSIAGKPVSATVTEAPVPTPDGTRIVGPRGGRYELIAAFPTAEGNLRNHLTVPTSAGRLVALGSLTAVVEVAEEW